MILIRRAPDHYHEEISWLATTHHFSFDQYYDPAHMNWGVLRVFNDDTLQPASGFPLHPHRDMEILTYVIRGTLAHEDSMGNAGTIGPGEVQIMSAGTGVLHAEFNASKKEDLHLLQMWVLPEKKGLKPRWEQKSFTNAEKTNTLARIVSSHPEKGEMKIFADASFYVSILKEGKSLSWKPASKKHVQYLFVIDGELRVNGKTLTKGESAKISGEDELVFRAETHTHFVMWDVGLSDE